NFGNETTNADYGIVTNGDRLAFNDERITVTQYAINTNAWIIHLPMSQEIRNGGGTPVSRTESFYDDETFSGGNVGLVTIGNLTLNRAYIDPVSGTFVNAARNK